jgi:hypothetical protein
MTMRYQSAALSALTCPACLMVMNVKFEPQAVTKPAVHEREAPSPVILTVSSSNQPQSEREAAGLH